MSPPSKITSMASSTSKTVKSSLVTCCYISPSLSLSLSIYLPLSIYIYIYIYQFGDLAVDPGPLTFLLAYRKFLCF